MFTLDWRRAGMDVEREILHGAAPICYSAQGGPWRMDTVVVAGRRVFMKYPELPELESRAAELGLRLVMLKEEQDGRFDQEAAEAAAVVVIARKISRETIMTMKRCRLVQTLSVGYDCVDVAAATERGIPVSNNPVYCTDEVAGHAMTLILTLARKITLTVPRTAKGHWDYNFARPIAAFAGRKLGIVGLGRIGRAVVPKARGFGMEVAAYDPYLGDDIFQILGVQRCRELTDLLQACDYVTIHTPLNGETRHLFDGGTLQAMRPDSILVNTARGGIIDEQALKAAVDQGRLAGAAVDVLESEPPPPDHPLLGSDRIIVTPHIAWYSEESLRKGLVLGIEEVTRVLQGHRPWYVVNPQVFACAR
jgi:D-3-phosphoglycerate dehydrogenase